MKIISVILCFVVLFFISCSKDNPVSYNPSVSGPLSVEFDNIAGSDDLHLISGMYTNVSGEHFSVTKLKYYVSNFSFVRADGTVYTVPQDSCYFLIDESDESSHEPTLNLPEGEYRAINFILGVDSLHSTLDKNLRPGILNPDTHDDMYFGVDSGYVFFNLEGNSNSSPTGTFEYHLGGYGGSTVPVINNIKKISLDLTQRGMPQVKRGKETNIHLMIDVLKFFDGDMLISISGDPEIGFEQRSVDASNNLPAMIDHDHTEN